MQTNDEAAFGKPKALLWSGENGEGCFSGELLQGIVKRKNVAQWVSWAPPHRQRRPLGRVSEHAMLECAPSGTMAAIVTIDATQRNGPFDPPDTSPAEVRLEIADAATGKRTTIFEEQSERVDSFTAHKVWVGSVHFSPNAKWLSYIVGRGHVDSHTPRIFVRDAKTLAIVGERDGNPSRWDGDALILWGDRGEEVRWTPGVGEEPIPYTPGTSLPTMTSPDGQISVERHQDEHGTSLWFVGADGTRVGRSIDHLEIFFNSLYQRGPWLRSEMVLGTWLIDPHARTARRLIADDGKSYVVSSASASGDAVLLTEMVIDEMAGPSYRGLHITTRAPRAGTSAAQIGPRKVVEMNR